MAQNPCPILLDDCTCVPSPLANLSSEAPDAPVFLALNYGTSFPGAVGGPVLGGTPLPGPQPCLLAGVVSQQASQLAAEDCGWSGSSNPPGVPNPDPTGTSPVPVPINPPVGGGAAQPPTGGGKTPVVANTMQTGMAVCPDGTQFSYTVPAGVYVAKTLAQANAKALSYANRQAQLQQVCLGEIQPQVCANTPYTATVSATGPHLGRGSFVWFMTFGALPPGVNLGGIITSGPSNTISGTPTEPGIYVFGLTVSAPSGATMQKFYTLSVAGISNAPTAFANGSPYSFALETVGLTNPVFSVTGGTLPAGLSLSAGGLVSGTPEGAVTSTVTITTVDGQTALSCEQAVTFPVAGSWCCDCPTKAQIVGYQAAQFAYDPSFLNPVSGTWAGAAGATPTGTMEDTINGRLPGSLGERFFTKAGTSQWFLYISGGSTLGSLNAYGHYFSTFGVACYTAGAVVPNGGTDTFYDFPNNQEGAFGPEWDGKFPLSVDPSVPGFDGDCYGSLFACSQFNGIGGFQVQSFQLVVDGVNYWFFIIGSIGGFIDDTLPFAVFWCGLKPVVDSNGFGVYTKATDAQMLEVFGSSMICTGPATVTLGPA